METLPETRKKRRDSSALDSRRAERPALPHADHSPAPENGVYALACDQCCSGAIWESLAADPMGVTIASAGKSEELISVCTDTDRVGEIRGRVASFDQRRHDLYRN